MGNSWKSYWGKTYWVDATNKVDLEAIKPDLEDYFKYYSLQLSNYGVEERWLRRAERIVI